MGWIKNWLFGQEPTRTQSAPIKPPTPKPDPHAEYLRQTLTFAQRQHQSLTQKQRDYETWLEEYSTLQAHELKKLSGIEFEEYLNELFKHHGYQVETTPVTGDYGADLILVKNNQRIAVQAKCYTGSVGVSAVQQALSGKAYYHCDKAWVVTTGNYTTNAVRLARKSAVSLLAQNELGELIIKMQRQL